MAKQCRTHVTDQCNPTCDMVCRCGHYNYLHDTVGTCFVCDQRCGYGSDVVARARYNEHDGTLTITPITIAIRDLQADAEAVEVLPSALEVLQSRYDRLREITGRSVKALEVVGSQSAFAAARAVTLRNELAALDAEAEAQ